DHTPPAAPAPPPSPLPANRPATVALLLPLSGPSAPVGAALFNAAQMALFEMADGSFNLLPFDSKGTAEGAVTATQQALGQHADIIIGPIFSVEAKAAAPLARQAGVAMVSFTTDSTAVGNGVFALGFLPGQQALRAADYARSQNRPRLAVLAPSNDYGRRVADFLSNAAPQQGISIAALEYYDAAAADVGPAVKRLVKADPRRPAGDPGFDALIIPDEGQRLRVVASGLTAQGIDPARVKILGTMLWDEGHVGTEPALVGAWYPSPPEATHTDFETRYARAFGGKPPRLASLGYDATALAAVLARRSPRDFSVGALTNPTGFAGVDGIFRLRQDGTAERGYAIREVQANGPDKEIAPAPASFQAIY
ncbi:MAG: penicillin-binding protein activator, partial [Telmatospirillum sp.]|nr:penicillin-binding protein activator [Telmatospirillum sp.]